MSSPRAVLAALILLTLTSVAGPTFGQETKKRPAVKKARAPQAAFAAIEEQPGLPRVLLIGDSISMGYTIPVRELLKGKANVVRPPANCGPTTRGLESLDDWLGSKTWDVIHFNWGLHDMVFFGADGKTRAEPTETGARHQVPLDQYEKNLRELVARLKRTKAILIWCSTTPVPAGSPGRIADEAVQYNLVAARIMAENQIRIDDLHAFASPKLAEIQLPRNVHFTPEGSKVLAEQVANSILSVLNTRLGK